MREGVYRVTFPAFAPLLALLNPTQLFILPRDLASLYRTDHDLHRQAELEACLWRVGKGRGQHQWQKTQ